MTPTETDLQVYFEGYARLFHLDLSGFCDRFNYPSITVRLDGGVQVFLKKEDAVTFFSEARQKFETEGCRQWSIDRLTAEPLGETAAVATIDWEMMRDDRSRIRGWRQTYNLLGRPGHWKVVLSTLHAGSEAG